MPSARCARCWVGVEDSPERAEAVRYAADRLDLPADTAAGLVPRTFARTGSVSPKLLDAGDRLERRLLAACSTSPSSSSATCGRSTTAISTTRSTGAFGLISSVTPRWRRRTSSSRARRSGAIAEEEHLDGDVARELFLRLEERLVRRELADLSGDDLARTVELQGVLAKIRDALDKVESELR